MCHEKKKDMRLCHTLGLRQAAKRPPSVVDCNLGLLTHSMTHGNVCHGMSHSFVAHLVQSSNECTRPCLLENGRNNCLNRMVSQELFIEGKALFFVQNSSHWPVTTGRWRSPGGGHCGSFQKRMSKSVVNKLGLGLGHSHRSS